ncbi:AAA family ATPase [Verrucosispora sp. WMMC514]|uniref:AAA family ATPase n=1 Tax=Verrucosispora sp. WMMC514 TaxID=3015156 RepID=UPI00248BF1F5|nr:AAA family ATPase [Verrucosispora sp. WMMC514]WBB94096.1 AAA family ATPase [Verrucosispora sp. WMMC514]
MSDVELVATRGIPASGKSTWAGEWVAENPAGRARISRDGARTMMHGGWLGTEEQERQVTIVTHGAILDLLRAGVSVVCDDTSLDDAHLTALWDIADRAGAPLRVVDFTAVPLELCLRRDEARTGADRVGDVVITGMWAVYVEGRPSPLPLPPLVQATVETPHGWLVPAQGGTR